jgi:hypothetical protein
MKPTLVSVYTGLAAALAMTLLAGCGLAETGAAAVTDAKASAEEAKQGKELEEKVKRDLDAAHKTESDRLKKADEEASQ